MKTGIRIVISGLFSSLIVALFGGMDLFADSPARRPLPDFGLMLNEDGDFSFTDIDVEISNNNLRSMLQSLQGSPIRTLVHSVATGSDIMLYPTAAGSVYGWREASGEQNPPWDVRMPILRAHVQAGTDAVRIAGEEADAMGLYFIPSFRVNDAHYTANPFENPLTGEFWLEHYETYTLGTSPVAHEPFKYLLDFRHPAVRAYRMDIISEVIVRYGDIMDGLQLDFMRHPFLFPPGTQHEAAPLITEWIREVRTALDAESLRQGKFLPLLVRVPPSLENCEWAGLEIERWMQEALIDVLIPSPSMSLAFDLPVAAFVAIAAPYDVPVYPAILNRNQFSWYFYPDPDETDYVGSANRLTKAEEVRAAVNNYLLQGAAGVEFYNFNLPPTEQTAAIIEAAENPMNGPRVYSITPAYWIDYEDTYEYRKQIPAIGTMGQTLPFSFQFGELIDPGEESLSAILRLGLRDLQIGQMTTTHLRHSSNITPVAGVADSIAAAGWSSARLADSRYFELQVYTGGVPTFAGELAFAQRRINVQAPTFMTIKVSLDNFATHTIIYEGILPNDLEAHDYRIDLTAFPFLQNVNGTITFRIYGGNHTSGAGIWSLANHSELGAIQVTARSSFGLEIEQWNSRGFWIPTHDLTDRILPDGRIRLESWEESPSFRLKVHPR